MNNNSSLRRFQSIWGDLENKYNFKYKDSRIILKLLIRDWCEKLGYSYEADEIIQNCQNFQQDNKIITIVHDSYLNLLDVTNQNLRLSENLSVDFLTQPIKNMAIKPIGELLLDKIGKQQFKKNITQTIEKGNSDMNLKFLALLAFTLTGIGIAIYLLNQKQSDRKQRRNFSDKQENYDGKPTQRQVGIRANDITPNIILFLAVDAEYAEGIIEGLRKDCKMTQEAVEVLSRTATIQALWQGSEEQFNRTRINECFDYSPSQEQNQYDVYLIKIELDEPEREFEQDMPQTSRGRGFKRLLTKRHKITVFGRYPKESINNPNLYR